MSNQPPLGIADMLYQTIYGQPSQLVHVLRKFSEEDIRTLRDSVRLLDSATTIVWHEKMVEKRNLDREKRVEGVSEP